MDDITRKATLMYIAGYKLNHIEHVLGEGSTRGVRKRLTTDEEKARAEIVQTVKDKVIEANAEYIQRVKKAEWDSYESINGILMDVTVEKMAGMSPKDRYLHVKTLLAAQKYVYNTLGVKASTDTPNVNKLTQVNISEFRLTGGVQ